MHLEKREKIIIAWEDLDNLNFPHVMFTSVIMCNCDCECDHKVTHVILVSDHLFFTSGKEQLDAFHTMV